MTLQEENFVNAYFLHNGNATKAAEVAGYSDPNANGPRIKHQADVKAEISRRLDEMAMPANEVLARLADHAASSLGDVLSISGRGIKFDVAKAIKTGKIHLVKSYSKGKDGTKVEMVDAQGALTTLARHHGLLKDRVSVSTEGLDLLRQMLAGDDEAGDDLDGDAQELDGGPEDLAMGAA